MSESFKSDSESSTGQKEAAAWMWRLDRGLSAEEQDAFFDWLAKEPRNTEYLEEQRRIWKRLDKLAAWRPEHGESPNPDLLAPPSPSKNWFRSYFLKGAAAVAALALIAFLGIRFASESPDSSAQELIAARPEIRNQLADGSTVKLNEGASIEVLYSPEERRVRLEVGEAFFIVAKDPLRPFIVEVEGVELKAVGTAFNVRLEQDAFEVLVAEGVVKLDSLETAALPLDHPEPLLEANQRAIVSLVEEAEAPQIATLTKGEIKRVLAWQHGLMTFSSKPLGEIVEELNRISDVQLAILDTDLAATRFSGTFSSQNVDGFLRLLELGYGIQSEVDDQARILLRSRVN